ncbi:MAG: TolC family protein [Chitinispirillaceae bacterium]
MKRLLGIFILLFLLSAEGNEGLLKLARQAFPGYMIDIEKCSYSELDQLLDRLQEEQPKGRALQKQIEQAEFRIHELQQSFVPRFNMGINHQRTDFRERMVSVYTKVPVEWDNANPEQVDITLPNGGHGLLWMPKPTEYDWKYIQTHASRPYEGNSAGFSTGLHYNYHSGISLDLLNLNVKKRFSPETYGYDWYSSLDNSIVIPLLKILNSNLSPRETEIKNIKNTIENLGISLKQNQTKEKNRLLTLLLRLYLSWEKHHFYRKMIHITREQIAEVNELGDKNHLTVSEEIAIGNELQGYLSTQNIIFYEIISSASALNSKDSSLTIYRITKVDVAGEIKQLEKKAAHYLNLGNLERNLAHNPQMKIMENNLENIKSNLELNRKTSKIDLDLTGSVSLLTSSDLGFKTPFEATKMVFTNPDGLNTSVGMQFSMPISFRESDYKYQAAVKNYQIAAENFLASKADLKKNFHEMRIRLLNLKENVRAAQANLQYAKSRLKMSSELHELKRVSAFEYNSYRKEKIRSEFALKEAQIKYFTALAEFWAMMKYTSENEPKENTGKK